jgi:hypothetical protein
VIVITLLLIFGAASLLVTGLWQSSSPLLSGSIGASLLAAIVLVAGTRRAGRALLEPPESDLADIDGRDAAPAGPEPADRVRQSPPGADPISGQSPPVTIPVQGGPVRGGPVRGGSAQAATQQATAGQPAVADDPDQYADEADPPDEPATQQVSPADAARVGRMLTEVLVVDGRPRYHLPGCVHLLARECEPLPVSEAVELGFTPCSLCEPDSALLADARRV